MKFGLGPFYIDFTVQDLKDIYKLVRQGLDDIKAKQIYQQEDEYTIAVIDDRYRQTGYIVDYGRVRCSFKQLREDFDLMSNIDLHLLMPTPMLSEMFVGEIKDRLIESHGYLSGYESDTPDLKDFDIVLNFK